MEKLQCGLKYDGTNWSSQTSGTNSELLGAYFSSSSNGFAVGKDSKILYYNGSSWSEHNSGLTSYNIENVHIVNSSLAYAASSDGFGGAGKILKYNGSTWSTDYTFTGMGTEIFYGIQFTSASKGYVVGAGGLIKTMGKEATNGINNLKTDVEGLEGYPNPFNNKMVISYSLKEEGPITINIVDINGREVAGIINQKRSKGEYSIEYDGSGLKAGIYFIKLLTKTNSEVTKMIKVE